MSLKIGKEAFSLRELVEIADDNRFSVSSTSLGAEEGEEQRYVKKAVSWKGIEAKDAFKGNDQARKRLQQALPENTYRALKEIAEQSKGLDKIYGTVLVEYPDGIVRKMSMKNWETIEKAWENKSHNGGYKKVRTLSTRPSKPKEKSSMAVTA